jgi:hypothetical protein
MDFQASLEFNRFKKKLDRELIDGYRMNFYEGFVHPQRELSDAVIYDAEYRQDIQRRIEEQRHQTALVCVALGIYKDTYEAKQGVRRKWPSWSHLLPFSFRENDRSLAVQVQAPSLQGVI